MKKPGSLCKDTTSPTHPSKLLSQLLTFTCCLALWVLHALNASNFSKTNKQTNKSFLCSLHPHHGGTLKTSISYTAVTQWQKKKNKISKVCKGSPITSALLWSLNTNSFVSLASYLKTTTQRLISLSSRGWEAQVQGTAPFVIWWGHIWFADGLILILFSCGR